MGVVKSMDREFLVLDTETTGLQRMANATVIDVALVAVTTGIVRKPPRVLYEALINPGRGFLGPEAEGALRYCGITRTEIEENGRPPETVRDSIQCIVEGGRFGNLGGRTGFLRT